MLRRCSAHLVLIVAMLPASVAGSAHADRKEDAAKAAERGDHAYAKSDWAKALEEYQASFEKYPKPFLLFRIAESQRQLGKDAEALETYKKYLAKVSHGADRKKAQAYVAELQPKIDAQKATDEKAEVAAAPVPQAPDVEAPPMKAAEVRAAKNKKGPPPVTTATSPKADVLPPGYDPNAPPPDPTARYVDPSEREAESAPKPVYKRWWLWTAVVGGVVVVGVGLGVGLALGLPKFTSELPVGGPGASGLTVRSLTVRF